MPTTSRSQNQMDFNIKKSRQMLDRGEGGRTEATCTAQVFTSLTRTLCLVNPNITLKSPCHLWYKQLTIRWGCAGYCAAKIILDMGERLGKISNDIFRILDANREANQFIPDPQGKAFFRRGFVVGHDGWQDDEAVHAAQ
jgi:hypothetical protein